MIRETELNLLVPSPELLVRLASGNRPLGIRASAPKITMLRETYFDTMDRALRRRGMTCRLQQAETGDPAIVVTIGDSPDSEGITSRSRLTAAAIGLGVFETLRGNSEPAEMIRKYVDPGALRPVIALDIQRLARSCRVGLVRRPVLQLCFDRITVRRGEKSAVFHEIRIRRQRKGGPPIRDLSREISREYHLFPDGMSTLQRAYRVLAMGKRSADSELSPYAMSLALAVFRDHRLALRKRGGDLCLPSFRGSGEDAARALCADLLGEPDLRLERLGTTEPRPGRPVLEIWAAHYPLPTESRGREAEFAWYPWCGLLEHVGRPGLADRTLISTLLLMTRRTLMGQVPWLLPDDDPHPGPQDIPALPSSVSTSRTPAPELEAALTAVDALLPTLRAAEQKDAPLRARLKAASDLSRGLSRLFLEEVARAKSRALSADEREDELPLGIVDLISIRVRGIVDRLCTCVTEDFLPGLEALDIQVRGWGGLMHQDRKTLLRLLESRFLPAMEVAPEWGAAFMPRMPPAGCAVGLFVRTAGSEAVRFAHLVLGPDTPSFLVVPGSTTAVPLEEVVRGFFIDREPQLERAETYLFRFTTGEVRIEEPAPASDGAVQSAGEAVGSSEAPETGIARGRPPERASSGGSGTAGVDSETARTSQSIVVRVLVQQRMPEDHQARLLRALERQVGRRDPLIGWSDLYAVRGPLDLSGIDELIELESAAPPV